MTPTAAERYSLTDRVAIVTGAAGLLGRAHAAALREAGAHVVLADCDAATVADSATLLPDGPGDIVAAPLDVTSPGAAAELRRQVIDRFGRIDVLVNNAAINDRIEDRADDDRDPSLFDYPLDTWRRMIDVNVTGVFICAQVFGAPMVAARRGSIINIASTYAFVGPDPSLYNDLDGRRRIIKSPAYPTAKAAVVGLTRHLAAAWGRDNVRVNALAPGGVENGQAGHFVARYAERTPLGRMAAPTDFQGALVFLASDASRYMTGAVLVVDGGFTSW